MKPTRDMVDYEIEWQKENSVMKKNNAANSEIADTLMYVVLAFITGGLFLPFLLYHIFKYDNKTREIDRQHPYLFEGIDDLNRSDRLTEEDKQHFFENPMHYKIGINKYAEFEPETKHIKCMTVLHYKSRNPRFKYGEYRDCWWNKPYWDIVDDHKRTFLISCNQGKISLLYKQAKLLDSIGKKRDDYDEIIDLYNVYYEYYKENNLKRYKWDDVHSLGNGYCDKDFIDGVIDYNLRMYEYYTDGLSPSQKDLCNPEYNRERSYFGTWDLLGDLPNGEFFLFNAEFLVDNYEDITGCTK